MKNKFRPSESKTNRHTCKDFVTSATKKGPETRFRQHDRAKNA